MSVTVTETKLITITGGSEGRARVFGTAAVVDPDTEFVIAPGYAETNVDGSKGIISLDTWSITNASAEKAPKVVLSHDATTYSDELTVTGDVDTTYDYWAEGTYVEVP